MEATTETLLVLPVLLTLENNLYTKCIAGPHYENTPIQIY